MSIINYAVEIFSDKTLTDTTYGLTNGVFRWITGRPGYTGSYPSGDYPTTVLSRTPINYWRFQETSGDTAVDSAGSSDFVSIYDPTFGLAGPTEVPGDTSLLSGGNLNSPTALNIDSIDEVLFESWIYIPVLEDYKSYEFSIQHDWGNNVGSYFSFRLNTGTGDPSMGVSMLTTGEYTDPYIEINSMEYPSTGWHYFIVTYKDKILTAYVDGVVKGTDTNLSMSTISFKTAPAMYLGGYYRVCETALYTNDWYTSLVTKDWYNYLGTTGPTWEDSTPNTSVWYQDWMLRDNLGDPSRQVDISESGDYGTLSGLNFSIRNDLFLWKYMRDNHLYLTNRLVKFYTVIDDVFYPTWSGVVSNEPYNETDYTFKCTDSFKKIHKMLPPEIIDSNTYPGSDDDSQGKAIPITFGNVNYAKLIAINSDPSVEVVVLSKNLPGQTFESKAAGALSYDTNSYDTPRLHLYTKGISYTENELANLYIYVARGGGLADVNQLMRVLSNEATTASFVTIVELETPFEFVTQEQFNERYLYDPREAANPVYEDYLWGQDATNLYNVTATTQFVKQVGYLTIGGPVNHFDLANIDFSTDGFGCSRFDIDMDAQTLGTVTVDLYTGGYGGTLIGTTTFDASVFPTRNTWPIYFVRQYGASTTITVSITSSVIAFIKVYSLLKVVQPSSEETWWFSALRMNSTYVISSRDIVGVERDAANLPYLFILNKDTNKMERVTSQIFELIEDRSGSSGHPQFILYSSRLQKKGDVSYLVPIPCTQWGITIPEATRFKTGNRTSRAEGVLDVPHGTINEGYINVPDIRLGQYDNSLIPAYGFNISNRNQLGPLNLVFPDTAQVLSTYSFNVDLAFPTDYIDYELDNLYVGIDIDVNSYTTNTRLFVSFIPLDAYGNEMVFDEDTNAQIFYPTNQVPVSGSYTFNSLPLDYYRLGGTVEPGYSNLWGYSDKDLDDNDITVRSMLTVPSAIFDALKDGTSARIVRIKIGITSDGKEWTGGVPFYLNINLKEIGFVGLRSINALNDQYYVRLKGELTGDGEETSNVYTTFKHILQDYDGIPATDINYNNLQLTRSSWKCGRQITERLSSFDYLKELAKQSFVCIYPTRDSKRGLKAWREDLLRGDTVPIAITQDNILRDSISNWEKTSVSDLYTDFRLEYDYSEATKVFQKIISVTNTDKYYEVVGGVTGAEGFPGATGMMDFPADLEVWRTYVGGVSPGSYKDASTLWDAAHNGFDRASAIQELPSYLSELYWYTNSTPFNELNDVGASKQDAPYQFLSNLVQWTTFLKDRVTFSLPVNATNIKRELLDYVTFTDTVYTDGELRYGWVTKVELDTKKDSIKIELTLSPEDIVLDNIIIENGLLINVDTIEEDGTQPDEFVEG